MKVSDLPADVPDGTLYQSNGQTIFAMKNSDGESCFVQYVAEDGKWISRVKTVHEITQELRSDT